MQRLFGIFVLMLLLSACGARAPAPAPGAPRSRQRFETIAEKRAAFAQAYDAVRLGDDGRALPTFLALAEGYPELADYALYFAGSIAARQGDDATAAAAFTRLLGDYPDSVKARATALELGKLYLRTDHVEQARSMLQSALAAADKSTVEAARLALAQADERQGNGSAAYAGYMEVRRTMTGTALARSAKQQILALRTQHPELVPVGPDLLDEARLLLTEHDYAAAGRVAQELLQQPEVQPAEALRIQADALYGSGDIEAALTTWRRLVDRYPASPAAPSALFRMASVLWNRDRDDAALAAFTELARQYPDDAHAPDALYATGRIHESAGRGDLARRNFAALVQRYAHSSVADEGRWHIGWLRYRGRDWAAAADAFARFAVETTSPRLRNEALYWQGRALERGGRVDEARRLYRGLVDHNPADYYAMWAERRLGLAPGTSARLEPAISRALAEPSNGAPILQPAASGDAFHLSRWAELKAARVYGLARGELSAIEAAHADVGTLRALLGAYQQVDGFAAAQRLLRRLGESAALSDSERQQVLYPLAFWDIVSQKARGNSVDPLLVEAVMRQESLFDPEAKSSANAYGLMQLLPATATRLAANDRAIDPPALFQPDINIDLGTRYLNSLSARFGGDLLKALAAYNGGEAAVEKWQRRFPDLDADEFVESITYRETRDYVKRVVTNYRTYQQLYATGPS